MAIDMKQRPGSTRHDVPELQDFQGSISEMQIVLSRLEAQYGPDALVEFDAGHNNVSVIVSTPLHPPQR